MNAWQFFGKHFDGMFFLVVVVMTLLSGFRFSLRKGAMEDKP